MKKLLHERLREWADSTEGDKYPSTKMLYATIESDHAPLGADDERKAFHLLANEIEKYYIPRPRFEDGEPVQRTDMEEIGGLATCRVYTDGSWTFDPDKYEDERNPKPWDEQQGRQCDFIKRPEPKVLDADGAPCKKGETVWRLVDSTKWEVTDIHPTEPRIAVRQLDTEKEVVGGWFLAEEYSHREPDSLEKLRDEMLRWTYNPARPGEAVKQWADRLTAIMERDA